MRLFFLGVKFCHIDPAAVATADVQPVTAARPAQLTDPSAARPLYDVRLTGPPGGGVNL